MPVYEYKCKNCGIEFEKSVNRKSVVTCSGCGSAAVMKKLSLFVKKSSPSGNKGGECDCGLSPEERAAKKAQCGCR